MLQLFSSQVTWNRACFKSRIECLQLIEVVVMYGSGWWGKFVWGDRSRSNPSGCDFDDEVLCGDRGLIKSIISWAKIIFLAVPVFLVKQCCECVGSNDELGTKTKVVGYTTTAVTATCVAATIPFIPSLTILYLGILSDDYTARVVLGVMLSSELLLVVSLLCAFGGSFITSSAMIEDENRIYEINLEREQAERIAHPRLYTNEQANRDMYSLACVSRDMFRQVCRVDHQRSDQRGGSGFFQTTPSRMHKDLPADIILHIITFLVDNEPREEFAHLNADTMVALTLLLYPLASSDHSDIDESTELLEHTELVSYTA